MNKSLSFRLSILLIFYTAAILIIASFAIINATHYHFQLYGDEMAHEKNATALLNTHLEQAIIQSIGWTIAGALVISLILSIYIAKKISAPLIRMKRLTIVMARGKRDVRLPLKGKPKDEVDELAASINHLAEQLQQQEHLRVTMTENIAHELRTPLTTLNSYLSAIQDGIWEATPERIQSSREEIDRMVQLVNGLEELHTLTSPEFHLSLRDVHLMKTIEQVFALMEPSFSEKGISLKKGNIPDITIHADENRLKQIWTNLLSNALKFSPEGGKVLISGQLQDEGVEITVGDTGIGIPNNEIPYVFDRFYKVDKSRNRQPGGGGLGLAITKTLVERHGGQIWAESNQGTQFHVYLPKKERGENHEP
ncbi:HAMP domain-containing sensor histidine kinase [Paenibacillus sp. LHD-38]|uniref:sensor histidine kinase n=1 Tax=Paenibacillus sp. LHD-38 TaxID=3072143 RepID=UPI00280F2106|nr:HAMP domain-containing sensor histidine kinase [Paenibacillus sp. LHD-38]MDQ8734869.1 HAMP domain-containing sensor histidine kinase [Paenibacillus sp. LHD-38]